MSKTTHTSGTFNYPQYWTDLMGEKEISKRFERDPFYYSSSAAYKDKWEEWSIDNKGNWDNYYNEGVVAFVTEMYYKFITDQYYEVPRVAYTNSAVFRVFLKFALPNVAECDPMKIAVFKDEDKFDRNIRTAMKVGKFIRWIFPTLKDKQVEAYVNIWKERNTPKEWEFKWEETGFSTTYIADQVETYQPSCDDMKKLLNSSCMRYDFDFEGYHPVDAYETGDFILASFWLGDKLVARTLVYKENMTHGPIYVTSDISHNAFVEKLKEKGATPGEDNSWVGAKLKKIECDGEYYVLPYLDLEPRFLEDRGDYFVISGSGDVAANESEGQVYHYDRCVCYYCDDRINEDDCYSTPNGDISCEQCYNKYFTACNYCGDDIHRNNTVAVITREGHSSDEWCVCCVEDSAVFVSDEGEYYSGELIRYLKSGDAVLASEEGYTWGKCDITDDAYTMDELVTLEDGRVVSTEYLEANDYVFNTSTQKWHLFSATTEEEEVV